MIIEPMDYNDISRTTGKGNKDFINTPLINT